MNGTLLVVVVYLFAVMAAVGYSAWRRDRKYKAAKKENESAFDDVSPSQFDRFAEFQKKTKRDAALRRELVKIISREKWRSRILGLPEPTAHDIEKLAENEIAEELLNDAR